MSSPNFIDIFDWKLAIHSSLEMRSLQYNWDWRYGNADLHANIALLSGDYESNIIVTHSRTWSRKDENWKLECDVNVIESFKFRTYLIYIFNLLSSFMLVSVCLSSCFMHWCSFFSITDYGLCHYQSVPNSEPISITGMNTQQRTKCTDYAMNTDQQQQQIKGTKKSWS